MVAKVVVYDNKRLRAYNARIPEVHAAVLAKTTEIYDRAQALFASHDRPGGHRIIAEEAGDTDGLVSLVGPAAVAVERGHWTSAAIDSADRKFVKGLHILTRAALL